MFDYIDERVASGMVDIGIDLKAVTVGTLQRITGLNAGALAKTYMENYEEAVRYLRKYFGTGLLPLMQNFRQGESFKLRGDGVLNLKRKFLLSLSAVIAT